MTAADSNEEVFSCPVFEGSEKRISVSFAPGPATPALGLRTLSRTQLDEMLDLAACQIVSFRSNAHFDAYVLSESSLFVYPDRMVLKTCGTTKLLSCVPFMEQLAAGLGMAPCRVKYTRASFLFPDQQPAPHCSFEHECGLLHDLFGRLGRTSAYVLGDALNGLQWHVFVAGTDQSGLSPTSDDKPIYTLEVCMTGLSTRKAAQFFRTEEFVSAQHTTIASGIQGLVPGAVIDDYVFEPCGYSMNGQQAGVFSTIHITPEDGFSYASFELCGYDPDAVDAAELVAKVMEVFHPRQVSVALSLDSSASAAATMGWSGGFLIPPKYVAHSSSYQEFKAGGYVAYFSLEGERAAAGKSGSESDASSPRAVLKHCPSFHTITPCDSSGAASDDALLDSASDNSSSSSMLLGRHSMMSSGLSLDPPSAEIGVDDVLALHQAVPLLKGDAPTLDVHMRGLIGRHAVEDTFLVVDLGAVQRLYAGWVEAMPRVRPYYEVRCNPDRAMVSMLAALGCGFSCASEAEVHLVLSLGIPADRILFANAHKRPRDVRFAAEKGVALTTFEGVGELAKLARWQPGARALLRVEAGAAAAPGRRAEWAELFHAAQAFGIEVAGVAVGVGPKAAGAGVEVTRAVEAARAAVDCGREHGCRMKLVDICCGALGGSQTEVAAAASALNAALDRHFPPGSGVRFVAEAGRYFAEPAATLASLVYARRRAMGAAPGEPQHEYWVAADGCAGGGAAAPGAGRVAREARALLLASGSGAAAEAEPCVVHGPAAGGVRCALPLCDEGDWVMLPHWGAYVLGEAGAGAGLGAPDTPTFYVCSREA